MIAEFQVVAVGQRRGGCRRDSREGLRGFSTPDPALPESGDDSDDPSELHGVHTAFSLAFHGEHRSPLKPAVAQPVEGLIDIGERHRLDAHSDRGLGREREKLLAVPAGQVGNREDAPLPPQKLIGE